MVKLKKFNSQNSNYAIKMKRMKQYYWFRFNLLNLIKVKHELYSSILN